jgi:hypothetical protein
VLIHPARVSFACVPGMARNWQGASPCARCSRSLRIGEGQGRRREAGSGGSPIQRCGATPQQVRDRLPGTGSEVWYDRDELARDSEVLHPQLGHACCVSPTNSGTSWSPEQISLNPLTAINWPFRVILFWAKKSSEMFDLNNPP